MFGCWDNFCKARIEFLDSLSPASGYTFEAAFHALHGHKRARLSTLRLDHLGEDTFALLCEQNILVDKLAVFRPKSLIRHGREGNNDRLLH